MTTSQRLPAIDLMRGIVMMLMAVDHVDLVINPHHAAGDSILRAQPAPLSVADFLTRWCTHLCAPTFVFLAGVSIALAAARRPEPAAQRAFDRHLAVRALVLIVLEFTYLAACFRTTEGPPAWAMTNFLPVFAQVIFTIGTGMLLLVPLRRLPATARAGLVVLLVGTVELANADMVAAPSTSLPRMLLLHFGFWSASGQGFDVLVIYPVLGWLPVMLLGHLVGERLLRGDSVRFWCGFGTAALLTFFVLRGLDGVGNMHLHRRDDSWIEWLHCSKYPPSVTFLAMELGLMALVLAGLTRACATRPPRRWNPVLVFGQVPLFFYLLHLPMIGVLSALAVLPAGGGTWLGSWAGAGLVVLLCWPLCALYRRYKQRGHRWTHYL